MLENRSCVRGALACLAVVVALAGMATAQTVITEPHVPGRLIIEFAPHATEAQKAAILGDLGGDTVSDFKTLPFTLHEVGADLTLEAAIDRYRDDPLVEIIEPDYIIELHAIPDDPLFESQWGMDNTGLTGGTRGADIDANHVWDSNTGSSQVIVAVIDSGVDYEHPDLADNVWTNPGEIPDNGLDDDGNGYVDDVRGWNFYNGDNRPLDDYGHGTHCAGIIGAVGNNGLGVAGVSWDVSIMALRFGGAGGGPLSAALACIDYAIGMGADVISASWGSTTYAASLELAVADAGAADILFVTSAGNRGRNNDAAPDYPSSFNLHNVLSVAASDHDDQLAEFSSYGAVSVDIAAPGVDIVSTVPGGLYESYSGTSMAGPHVAGVAALVQGRFPELSALETKAVILDSADPLPQLAGKVLTGGRLSALKAAGTPDEVPPARITDLEVTRAGSSWLELRWSAVGDDGMAGAADRYELRVAEFFIDEANFETAIPVPVDRSPAAPGAVETVDIRGLVHASTYYLAVRARDEWGNTGPVSNVPTGLTLGAPVVGTEPDLVAAAVDVDGTSQQTLNVFNEGEGTLDFVVMDPLLRDPNGMLATFDGSKALGGPDTFGYRWIDSNDPEGPVFDWVDISDIGTTVLSGTISRQIPLSFAFPLYGEEFTTCWVGKNGIISMHDGLSPITNTPLPNPLLPPFLIAPYFDWLAASGPVFAHDDGTRLIVQWHNVSGNDGGGPYTFQAILGADGGIVFQYLDMQGITDSATVGLQNGDGTDGLTVVYNAPYVANGLAVRLFAVPQWVTVAPRTGTVWAGQDMALDVDIDAAGLGGGTYEGEIRIISNDPATPVHTVPVRLDVTGTPGIVVGPLTHDFGELFAGGTDTVTVTVDNPGTDELVVTGITCDDPAFTVQPAAFTVAAGGQRTVTVVFAPAEMGAYAATMTVASDAAGQPAVAVTLAGIALAPPQLAVMPGSHTADLVSGGSESQLMVVLNNGAADLTYELHVDFRPETAYDKYPQLDPAEAENLAGEPVLQGFGGPDNYGYYWIDSDEPGGPAFSWTDISTTGTPVYLGPSGNRDVGPYPIGFPFPFYDRNPGHFWVCDNGYIAFLDDRCSGSNSPLPHVYSAPDMVAPFWDELQIDPSRGANVFYQRDGNRMIVQYHRVSQSFGGELTFQVILHTDGTILFQYLTMDSNMLDTATVGIQDRLAYDGLTVAHNTRYIHDNLAIRLQAFPEWLSFEPAAGVVPPGGGAPVGVVFDAAGMFAGRYEANIVVASDDPAAGDFVVPAVLNVTGVPEVAVWRGDHDFDDVFLGTASERQFEVYNPGTDDLVITDASVDNDMFTTTLPASLVLGPTERYQATVEFRPTAPGPVTANLVLTTNDPAQPVLEVPWTGTGQEPPSAGVDPLALAADLLTGESAARTVSLSNTGSTDLEYSVRTLFGATEIVVHESLELAEGEVDPRPGILGEGGPDMYGYRWKDSDEAGGPVFAWEDISGIGTPVFPGAYDDAVFIGLPVGFEFPFYGETFTTFNLCTNGWLSFTNRTAEYYNGPLPNAGLPENLLAVFFDDLYVYRDLGGVYYHHDGHKLIVQWHDVVRYGRPEFPYKFQVQLYPNGMIVYQYLSMSGPRLDDATIGIQNGERTDGLTVVFNADYVHDELAVRLLPVADWLQVTPGDGTVPPGAATDLQVTLDASELFGDLYGGTMRIATNDPDRPAIDVDVALNVTGAPVATTEPASVDFGDAFVGHDNRFELMVTNNGTDLLRVSDIVSASPSCTALPASFELEPFAAQVVTVTCAPASTGEFSSELRILSNDAASPLVVPLQGRGLPPPVLAWDPTVLEGVAPPGGVKTGTVAIRNTGASDLTWNLGVSRNAPHKVAVHDSLALDKAAVDPRTGILGEGGPDAFGYAWIDSDDPGGPVYDWVDISAVGTPVFAVSTDDVCLGPYPIGFAFPFYGATFTEFNVGSNGFVSFTSSSPAYVNEPLPNPGAPGNLIAPFWDDLYVDTDLGGNVYYHFDGTRLIVQYEVRHVATTSISYSLQAILYPDGTIIYQYASLGVLDRSATVGIQNGTRDDGLMMVFNDAYVRPGLAVRISKAPDWLTIPVSSGVVAPGESAKVAVVMDATELEAGDYTGAMTLTSNDPVRPSVGIDVVLHVDSIGVADLALDPAAIVPPDYRTWLTARIELPAGYDPADVLWETARCNGVVSADSATFAWDGDFNENGVPDLRLKFPLEEVHAILPEGDDVAVIITGEVRNTTYFTAEGSIRVVRPRLLTPNGGEEFAPGDPVTVTWTTPPGWTITYADVLYTPNDGATWQSVATGLTGNQHVWQAPLHPTEQARIRVLVHDDDGLLGFDSSDEVFSVNGLFVSAVREVPKVYGLGHAYPNPFNPVTRIAFDLPRAGLTRIEVYDLRGRRVKVLLDEPMPAGSHHVLWYGNDDQGARMASGVYFYRIRSRDFSDVKRMTLLK